MGGHVPPSSYGGAAPAGIDVSVSWCVCLWQDQDQLRDACYHLANMIEDIDKISFATRRYEPSDVAFCRITLALVINLIH